MNRYDLKWLLNVIVMLFIATQFRFNPNMLLKPDNCIVATFVWSVSRMIEFSFILSDTLYFVSQIEVHVWHSAWVSFYVGSVYECVFCPHKTTMLHKCCHDNTINLFFIQFPNIFGHCSAGRHLITNLGLWLYTHTYTLTIVMIDTLLAIVYF